MKEKELENIFRDAFQDFEATVDPSVWAGVEQGLDASAGASGGNAAGSDGGSLFGSMSSGSGLGIAAAGIGAITIALVSYLMLSDPDTNNVEQIQSNTFQTEQIEEVVAKNESSSEIVTPEENIGQVGQTTNAENNSTGRTAQNETVVASGEEKPTVPVSSHISNNMNQSSAVSVNKNETTQTIQPSISEELINETVTSEEKEQIKQVIAVHKNEPVAFIDASPVSGIAPLIVNFENKGYADHHQWDFGDGVVINSGNAVVHEFTKPGRYEVLLSASNAAGREDDNLIIIEVRAASVIPGTVSKLGSIPNVFTPNGDGKNDRFRMLFENMEHLDISIYDQNGQVVYKWKHIDDEWDGRYLSGKEAPSGTYFYMLKGVGKDQKGYEHKGSVTLFR